MTFNLIFKKNGTIIVGQAVSADELPLKDRPSSPTILCFQLLEDNPTFGSRGRKGAILYIDEQDLLRIDTVQFLSSLTPQKESLCLNC